MEKLFIEPTRTTPLIKFDPEEGVLEMRGRSSPENSIQFYQKVLENLEEFAEVGGPRFTANLAFEYFNTSSSKCLFDVFKRLSIIENSGKEIAINWYFEEGDDDMMEAGEDYSDLLDLEFNFFEIDDDAM
ncbi:MAG: DUF1987 domain-containing protein [Ekhidna sp.]|nr:DUF1987 domain-containing protein [Ekhidna sp.]